MTITKSDLKLLIPLIIFTIGGLYGAYSLNYIQSDKTLSITFKWFVIPSIIIGLFYAYRSTFGYEKKTAVWRNVLGLIALTIFFTMLLLRSFEGYLILTNCLVGQQTKTLIKGQVTRLNYPKNKKPLNNYKIEITTNDKLEIINIIVPDNSYFVGQTFEKEMTIGSLGFLYSY